MGKLNTGMARVEKLTLAKKQLRDKGWQFGLAN